MFRDDYEERALLIAICCRIRLFPNLGWECKDISRSKSPNDDSAAVTADFQVQRDVMEVERDGACKATLLATWWSSSSVGTQTVFIVNNGMQ